MSRNFDPEEDRRFYLGFDLPRVMKFEPEKTGPFNRASYMALGLGDLIHAHLLGLRDRVLPAAQTMMTWMEAQPHRRQGYERMLPRL
jgi:hypothetical protein